MKDKLFKNMLHYRPQTKLHEGNFSEVFVCPQMVGLLWTGEMPSTGMVPRRGAVEGAWLEGVP